MRNTRKILVALLVLMTLMVGAFAVTASAAAGQTWTVAGVKALCGTDWDTANKNNDMTYDSATDSYVKVYENVKAGNYQFKCAKDHKWGTAYPGSNYNLKVEKDGSTVTITLKGTTVTAKVEAPACDHKYEVTSATVTCLTGGNRTWTCSVCGDSYTEEKLDALGHSYDANGQCVRCDATTTFIRVYVNNAAKWANVYCYTWDTNPYVAWPGAQMAIDEATGYYYYDIPANFVNVIFNNGGSTQSDDLKTPTGKAVVYNNSTKKWGELHTCNFVAGEVVPPTFETDGYTVYSCTCGKTENRDVVPALVAVAKVGEVKYTDLQEAIKAAAPAGTVELLSDVTVEKWIMIAENLNIADGSLITLTVDGMTIDGNDHVLTVNSIESAGNGGYLFHGVSNLNVQDLKIKIAEGCVGGISLKSGNITNVTFDGGERAVMPGAGEVKIEGCTFKTNGHAVYYEEARDNLVVNNCTFELASDANVILLRGAEQFTNNTVVSGRTVNVVSGSPVVSGNNFGDVRVKVYNTATAKISNNTINNLVFGDETVAGSTFADNTLSESAQTALEAVLAPPHTHVWSDATCTEPQKCGECGETQGEALGHTPGAAATCTVPQTCTVCGAELAPTIPHVDTNLDITCDYEGCTQRILPPADSKVSLFTANHMIIVSLSNNYYVEGVVTEVVDAKNGGFVITDEAGDQLYIRMPVDANGVSHSGWQMKVVVGDVVSVYGKPKSTSGWNTSLKAGMQGGVLTFIDQHDHVAAGETICTKDTLCACGAVVVPATGHVDADNNGLCDNCNWDMNLVEVYIAIGTDPKYNGVRVDDEAGKALSWTWSNGGFDAIFTKGTSTVTLYTTARDYMQLKKQNLLTIVNTADVTVKYITISVTSESYLNTLKTAIGTQYEFTADATNFTVTIQLNSTEDFVLENKSTSTVYVNGVSIVYAKKGAHVHEFVGTVTTPPTCSTEGVKTFTCECGQGTYTEAIETIAHTFVDNACTVCSAQYVAPETNWTLTTELKNGDLVLIGNPAYGKLLSAEKVTADSFYNKGVNYSADNFANVTDAEIFVVKVNADGTYTFTSLTGDVIALAASYSSLNVDGEHKSWSLVDKGNGTFLLKNTGRNTYLEWYSSKGNWSTYNAGNTDEYYLSFYTKVEINHIHNHISSVVAPTCTEAGKTVYACACGDTYEVAGDAALGHDLVDVEASAPTCTEEGYTAHKDCSRCEYVEGKETVDALGHDMITDKAVAPTCTATGLTEGSHCSRCDHKVAQEEVPALGHTAGAEATCTTAQTCTVCNAELVAALGHDMMTHTETLPTCTETGLTAGAECSRCDHKTGLEEIPALGHDYAEGQCTRCGEKDPDYKPEEKPEDKPEEKPEDKPEEKPEEKPEDETPDEEPTPDVELSIFDKIMKTINELIAKLTAWFKNLFAGLKK